jgi:hypothetical protein
MKHDIQIKENTVLLDNKAIYISDFKVLAFLNIAPFVILVLDLKNTVNVNQNTICIDINGNHIWTIESKLYHQKDCPANSIYIEKGKYLIYRWCGIEEEIDIRTGKIFNGLLIK